MVKKYTFWLRYNNNFAVLSTTYFEFLISNAFSPLLRKCFLKSNAIKKLYNSPILNPKHYIVKTIQTNTIIVNIN